MTDEGQRRSSDHMLGEHSAKIEGLQEDMAQLKKDVRCILTTLSEARGGWKTLMLVAGVAGAIGAAMAKLSSLFNWFPK